jgi:hypothetical protein
VCADRTIQLDFGDRFPHSNGMTIAFDTLKLAQWLEAAGFPPGQAQQMASALGETIGAAVVTREYLDLRLAELRTALARDIADGKAETLKWIGAIGLQTVIILGGVAVLFHLVK